MLTGLHSVVIEVGDLDGAVSAQSRLLGRTALVDRARRCAVFRLANTRLELCGRMAYPEAGEGVSKDGRDGIVRLRLAGRAEQDGCLGGRFAAGPLASPTVALELVVESSPPIEEVAVEPGIVGLDHVVIATPDPDRARAFLSEELGIRLALDRSFPERGIRILFFRLGGVTLELATMLETQPPAPPGLAGPGDAQRGEPSRASVAAGDVFRGLAWKVRNLETTRARLLAEGFALSSIRAGHKPGTRVCSLREPLCGVPTLLIEHP